MKQFQKTYGGVPYINSMAGIKGMSYASVQINTHIKINNLVKINLYHLHDIWAAIHIHLLQISNCGWSFL